MALILSHFNDIVVAENYITNISFYSELIAVSVSNLLTVIRRTFPYGNMVEDWSYFMRSSF